MKRKIRTEIKILRNDLNQTAKEIKDKLIIDKILNDPNFNKSFKIGIYLAFNNEVDLASLLSLTTKEFYAPKIDDNDELIFIKIDENSKFASHKFGNLEPINGPITNQLDYIIVPAVAISKNLTRVGYGKGYYDKYLLKNKIAYKVGVIYKFQEVEYLKPEPQDVALDYYFTEESLWTARL